MLKLITYIFALLVCGNVYAENAYTIEYGASKIVPAAQVYPDFKQGEPLVNYAPNARIVVIIASTKDLKINATKNFFNNNQKFKNTKITFNGLKAASNIAEEPIGLANSILGAGNRIDNAKMLDEETGGDGKLITYYVAIENFFSEMPTQGKPTDHSLVMIESPDGKRNKYLSDGVEICRDIYEIVITPLNFTTDHTGTKSTIGEYLAFNYRIDPSDWFGYVTDTTYSREQQIASAFKYAASDTLP